MIFRAPQKREIAALKTFVCYRRGAECASSPTTATYLRKRSTGWFQNSQCNGPADETGGLGRPSSGRYLARCSSVHVPHTLPMLIQRVNHPAPSRGKRPWRPGMIMATELTISTMSMTVPESDGPLLDQAGPRSRRLRVTARTTETTSTTQLPNVNPTSRSSCRHARPPCRAAPRARLRRSVIGIFSKSLSAGAWAGRREEDIIGVRWSKRPSGGTKE